MTRRILSLWLPLWSIERHQKQQPAPSRTGLALYAPERGRLVVTAADPIALRLGIRHGMPLAQARAMQPDLHVAQAEPAADQAALEALTLWCQWLSPLTAMDGTDGVWVDTTGCDHLFGGEDQMAERLLTRLARAGYSARIALADTAATAAAVARSSRHPLTLIPPGGQATALRDLPLASLRLEPETLDTLSRLGLVQVGQLLDRPRAPLARRFGQALPDRIDQAMGRLPEPLSFRAEPQAFRVSGTLVEPISTAPAIARALAKLVDELTEALTRRNHGARQLQVQCMRVDGTTQRLQLGLSNASADPVRLNRLLGERIETIEPGFGIEAFTLSATETAPLDAPANRDWLTPATDPTGLPALLERLMGRVGIQSLSRLQTGTSQFPEREQAYTGGERVQRVDELPPSCSHGPRPARLLPAPCPITVRAFWPDGAPKAFQWGRTRHTIHGLIGPERVWSDWWHDRLGARARDYWVAETLEGERFWLFAGHDGAGPVIGQAAWFLHGLF
ncbi:DNA polymerase Y family protein [Acetobacter suratthaniensis]|uniref:DNA-directed DNA polymerase n=1 Tax=Acetobacter suratthaniensis TaxID=1502841 RepID=A0ABS3LNS4_9PROT|nr:DNA polymerase Y family protein [Acetobacter suratthaniensis]MBO1329008.1 DNA polymerase Y family protein [Acetobacter suratthaniensis]MCX2566971.1 DNA polymerase Y family protein [Acetobacter suratthaniensis]